MDTIILDFVFPLSIARSLALRAIFVFAGILLSSVTPVRAQSTNASLTGRITDSSKALFDANVLVINTGTRIHYETVTNRDGKLLRDGSAARHVPN